MKLFKFFILTACILTMAGCQKKLETEVRIVSFSPQTAVENQTNQYKLRLIINHPEGDYYLDVRINDVYQKQMALILSDPRYVDMEVDIDIPEVDGDQVEFAAELSIMNEEDMEVVASDSIMLPVTLQSYE